MMLCNEFTAVWRQLKEDQSVSFSPTYISMQLARREGRREGRRSGSEAGWEAATGAVGRSGPAIVF